MYEKRDMRLRKTCLRLFEKKNDINDAIIIEQYYYNASTRASKYKSF